MLVMLFTLVLFFTDAVFLQNLVAREQAVYKNNNTEPVAEVENNNTEPVAEVENLTNEKMLLTKIMVRCIFHFCVINVYNQLFNFV